MGSQPWGLSRGWKALSLTQKGETPGQPLTVQGSHGLTGAGLGLLAPRRNTVASPRQGPSPGWCQPCPNGPVLASQSSSLPRRALPGGGDLFIRNSWGKWPVMSVGARVPRERNDTQ